MAFTVRWDFRLATFRLTRRIVWQAQYFVTVWPGREELKVFGLCRCASERGSFCMAFTVRWDFWLAAWSLTRRIVWQAQYFVTVWLGRKELKVSSFLGAQVNTARFTWHLQYAGTFDWLLSAWRVELCGRHNTLWRSDLGGRNWKRLAF